MNDPVTTMNHPPPRYLLESDSSDEEGQGQYPSTSRQSRATPHPSTSINISFHDDSSQRKMTDCVVGVGQAGRYLLRKAGSCEEVMVLKIENEIVGQGLKMSDESLLVVLEEVGNETAWNLVEKLSQNIKPQDWIVVSSYVPSMYIPNFDDAELSRGDLPIRSLQSSGHGSESGKGVGRWESPNYLTGIEAAFVTLAVHPAYPQITLSQLKTLMLPLPLSSLDPSILQTALPSSSTLIAKLQRHSKDNASRWTEVDDEPYTALGMGKSRVPVHINKDDAFSMYT